jgi:hypothetical protein
MENEIGLHVICTREMKYAYKILVGKPEDKDYLAGVKRIDIGTVLKETRCGLDPTGPGYGPIEVLYGHGIDTRVP